MMSHSGSNGDTDDGESYTVYHKLTLLCSEIETAIKSGSRKSRDDVQAQILRIRSEAFTMHSPEAEYALRLFRCYLEEVNDSGRVSDNINLTDELPTMLYEGHPDQLAGLSSVKKNIFWMRVVVGGFSFLSFVIMASVPNMDTRSVGGSELFLVWNRCHKYIQKSTCPTCSQESFVCFNFFRALIVVFRLLDILITSLFITCLPVGC